MYDDKLHTQYYTVAQKLNITGYITFLILPYLICDKTILLPLFLACRRQRKTPMTKMTRMTTAAAADAAMIVIGGPLFGGVGDGAENRHMHNANSYGNT